MGGMQRPGMVGQMQHAQQPMKPPPYGRGGTQQGAYSMSGTAGPTSNYGGNAGQPMMLGQSMSQNSQSQSMMQQGMQNLRGFFPNSFVIILLNFIMFSKRSPEFYELNYYHCFSESLYWATN